MKRKAILVSVIIVIHAAAFDTVATNILVNGDFNAPPILGPGQTDVGIDEIKTICTNSADPNYASRISGVQGWTYALPYSWGSDHGLARPTGFGDSSGPRMAFMENWERMMSQSTTPSLTTGTVAVAQIQLGTLGSDTDGGRAGTFYLVAGETDPANPDAFSSRSIILSKIVVGNPTFSSQPLDAEVGNRVLTNLTLTHAFTNGDPALALPLAVAFRTEWSSVGPTYWDNASLDIAAPVTPLIVAQPASITNLVNSTAMFSVTAFGSPQLTYQWRKDNLNLTDGARVSGATTARLAINTVQMPDSGIYSVVVSNLYGSVTSSVATLTVVTSIPIVITNSEALPQATAGMAYSITLVATGGVAPYTWSIASGRLPSGLVLSTNSGVLSGMPASAGAYNFGLQVSSSDGLTVRKSFALNVDMGMPQQEAVSTFLSTPASNSLYTVPVVIIRFLPTTNGVDLDVTKAPDFWSLNPITLSAMKGNIDAFTDRLKFGLEQGTRFRGYNDPTSPPSLGYKVVDILTFYQHTPAGPFYTVNTGSTNENHFLDYSQIMQAINGSNYVNNLGVREFWVWHGYFDDSYPSYQDNQTIFDLDDARAIQESNMSSALTGDISNSPRFNDLPIYGKTYTVYEHNIRRSHEEALHDHGHQIEALMSYFYTRQDGNSDFFWRRFVANDPDFGPPVTGRCGWTHMPPNTTNNYDWFNPAVVMSDIQDWRPDGSGTWRPFGTNTFLGLTYQWPGGYVPGLDSSMWFIFWWQSMPGFNNGIPNGTNGIPNWWTFTADWDSAIVGEAVAPTITLGPASSCVMAGQSITLSSVVSSPWTPARFQWTFNGQNISGATNSSLSLVGVGLAQQGNYAVTAYNLAGSRTSTPALLTVVTQSLFLRITNVAGTLPLSWNGISGSVYQVQFKNTLLQTNWINLGSPITATSNSLTTSESGTNLQGFFRILQVR